MTTRPIGAGLVRIAAAAILLLPSQLQAQAGVSTDAKATAVDTTDRGYVELLTKAHTSEIEAGRTALASTQNPEVRAFAQKLVDDHTKALDKLSPIATRIGGSTVASATPAPTDATMRPAPETTPRDTTLPSPDAGMGAVGDSAKASMTKVPPTDKQFIDAMVVNHQQLLGKLPEDGRGIKDKELRSYVGEVRKSVQRHFTMARDIQTRMGGREK